MLDLERDGAQHFRRVLPLDQVEALTSTLETLDQGRPGERLPELHLLDRWLGPGGTIHKIVADWLGPVADPVRAILFDKNPAANWALGWHQDRTIAVASHAEVEGFQHWNKKDGVDHVEPPFDLIERMLTVRIHLDPVSADNAPLLISPGTHRLGRIREVELEDAVERHGSFACLADAGDVWVYRTAIVHASKRASAPHRRRVLQVDYSADELPGPLRWSLKR